VQSRRPALENADGIYDIAIVGGGINGCGVARDAAGRGFSVLLAEMGDLAGGTSSASTKLIHGGLRYLEHFEFRLVHEALAEREVLLSIAPHIARPLRFILPHHAGLRPAWLLRAGLFLYDHLGPRRTLPGTATLDLRCEPAASVLNPRFRRAFEYSDCWVDDARLVVLNARDAADKGAEIRTRTKIIDATRERATWRLTLVCQTTGRSETIRARLLINAAGPWLETALPWTQGHNTKRTIRLVKGSHIVVPRIGSHDQAFIFQNKDGRIVFLIPYERNFSLIGTTDEDYYGDPSSVSVSRGEIEYLCEAVSGYLVRPVAPTDIVRSFSGVRSLFDDGATKAQSATRDYVLEVEGNSSEPRRINVVGGKITTYRRLAEAVMTIVETAIGRRRHSAWTSGSALPGGDFAGETVAQLVERLERTYRFIDHQSAERLIRSYGTTAFGILSDARCLADLGRSFGPLSEREVSYLRASEWAVSADDILWRRSKLGLHLDREQSDRLVTWLQGQPDGARI